MAKLITKFKYIKAGQGVKGAKYLKYIAYRNGVEPPRDYKPNTPASVPQEELIEMIIKDFPDAVKMHEYDDYLANPTKANASDFIGRVLEDNAHIASGQKTYADYMATRPRAEKIGGHGLFSDEGVNVKVEDVSRELQKHDGNIWTVIISLRREDAQRLLYDNPEQWRDTIRKHAQELADALRIPFTDLKWFGAFHNESHHPHVHLIAYTDDPKMGFLSQRGVMKMRSSLAKDIFADDLLHAYKGQTEYRDQLKGEWREMLEELLRKIKKGNFENPELAQKLLLLSEKLSQLNGKKVYGYLPKHLRDLVNEIVDLMADDPRIAELYKLWYEKKCEARRVYTSEPPPEEPLSDNKEFKSIKNEIIKEALDLQFNQNQHISPTAVTRLFKSLAHLIEDRITGDNKNASLTDSKQRRAEQAKKRGEEIIIS